MDDRPERRIEARRHTDDVPKHERRKPLAPQGARQEEDSNLWRVLIFVAVILSLAAAGAAFLILGLKKDESTEPAYSPAPPAVPSADAGPETTVVPDVPAPRPPTTADPVVPEPPAATEEVVAPEADPASTPGTAGAAEVAEDFLNANNLAGRLDLIETTMSASDMKATVLDSVLPEFLPLQPAPQTRNTAEAFIDYPFITSFPQDDGTERTVVLMVRTRDRSQPKVLAQPFVDLYGSRLKDFVKEPVEGEPSTFQVIIEPMPRVFEEGIPNPDKKFTYKLMASFTGSEIGRAYASQQSSLAEQLYNFSTDSRIRWGQRQCATVVLAWNTEEDPDQPYIEMVAIRSYDWSP